MEKIEKALAQTGYNAINIDYASRKKTIEALVEDIDAVLKESRIGGEKKVHFIGYSMGGLVIRAYIAKHRPANLGRVVMLAVPNQGSEVADALKDSALYRRVYGPAGQELVTDQARFKKLFGDIDYDIGVIAGDRSIDPLSSLLFLPGKDDGKVSIERTKIDGMKDHIVLHTTHTFIMKNDDVIRQALHFLKHGAFERAAPK
jgi:pimeloyl-ACP methyl ester carboxylesterase